LGDADEGFGCLEERVGVLFEWLVGWEREGRRGRRTWSRRENGRHCWKVAFESMDFINCAQFPVILLLKPISKGVGNGYALAVVATARPLDVVVDASLEVDDDVTEDEEESLLSTLRRLRSSGREARVQSAGLGGGLRSTRSGPERARRDASSADRRPSGTSTLTSRSWMSSNSTSESEM
jgi:hypothetical protein